MRAKSVATIFALATFLALASQGESQTFQVLHTFESIDGLAPGALTMDQHGKIYGTTARGGITNCTAPSNSGCGTVFQLSRNNSNWVFATVYQFQSNADGWSPTSPLTLSPDGNLYGTTLDGGLRGGYGSVFRLRPICKDLGCRQVTWIKTILYRFGQCDGAGTNGGLLLDAKGNLYGTTIESCHNDGQVYELSPAQNLDGTWNKTTLHLFQGPPYDGRFPESPLLRDQDGKLYGTTLGGGPADLGTVYQLTQAGNTWTETILYSFGGPDITHPIGNLIFDPSGNLYGATIGDPQPGGAFELTPSDQTWTISRLYSFMPQQAQVVSSGLVMDSAGNLYGASQQGGAYGYGTVYKLTAKTTPGNQGWTYSTVYDFTGGGDGAGPVGPLVLDAAGNLYGASAAGGDANCNVGMGCGTVWTVTTN